jgi:hypothetical protein
MDIIDQLVAKIPTSFGLDITINMQSMLMFALLMFLAFFFANIASAVIAKRLAA